MSKKDSYSARWFGIMLQVMTGKDASVMSAGAVTSPELCWETNRRVESVEVAHRPCERPPITRQAVFRSTFQFTPAHVTGPHRAAGHCILRLFERQSHARVSVQRRQTNTVANGLTNNFAAASGAGQQAQG